MTPHQASSDLDDLNLGLWTWMLKYLIPEAFSGILRQPPWRVNAHVWVLRGVSEVLEPGRPGDFLPSVGCCSQRLA